MLGIFFILLLTFAFLLSGISADVNNITHMVAMTSAALGFLTLFVSKSKLKIPPHFAPLLVFTLILNIYWIFSPDKSNPFYYSLTFTEGLAVWFIVYNLEAKITRLLPVLVFAPFFIYAILYFLSSYFNLDLTKLATMYFENSPVLGHQQIGSVAAVALAYLIGSSYSHVYFFSDLLFYLLAGYFLIISKSRSAGLAVLTSLLYVFRENKWTKYLFYLGAAAILIFIFYTSAGRSTLYSRVYFIQSLAGFLHHPLGVGMGNFRAISLEFYNAGGFLGRFSENTHNIFLEAISGVGILAIPFIYWGYKVLSDLIKNKNVKNAAWTLVFITISVIFMIDLTYRASGMILLWFIALAMTQKAES